MLFRSPVTIPRLIRYQRDLATIIDNNAQNVYNELNAIQDADARRWVEHRRSLDSRLDKLIDRLALLEEKVGITKQKKQLLND